MLTTVVGNYPKIGPRTEAPSLRGAINRYDRGEITLEELNRVAGEVTKEVIQEQVSAGVDRVTDGQVRWDDGQTAFARHIQGFSINGLIRYFNNNTYYRQPIVDSKLKWQCPITVEQFRFAQQHSDRPVKPVVTGPYTLARLSQVGHYPDLRSAALDLAEILNQEALALEEAGATFIQFDEPAIIKYKEDFPILRETSQVLTRGLGVKTAIYTYFGGISELAADFLRLPFHVIGLDFVAGQGNWDLLPEFPKDKELGFGILDARNTRMEKVEELVQAIQRVTRYVSPDRLYINPSCGLEFLPRNTAYNKLCRMVEATKKAQEVL